MRKSMVEKDNKALSIRRQCELLGINRNRLDPAEKASGVAEEDLELAREIDKLHLRFPEFGSRRISTWLRRKGDKSATRRRVGRVMKAMGVCAVYRRPRTSIPAAGAAKYPYLLKNKDVQRADEAWCADVTYLPIEGGFAYLVAVMDWKSRAVVSWRLSNTLDGSFCVQALREAFESTGACPEIFNTDQGCQFTAKEWIATLEERGVKISMDGKGRWVDNVFIERLWRSLKHEGIYLWSYDNVHDLERAVGKWIWEYNNLKPHSSLEYKTPWEVYRPEEMPAWKEAA
jgi:putative transposase